MQYLVRDSSGKVLDDSHALSPLKFTIDDGRFPPEFERQIQGMQPGQRKRVLIPAALGYGERKAENTLKINRIEVPQTDLVVGGLLRRLNANLESEVYTITGYVGDWVFLDKNHPLAGMDLLYEVFIVAVEQGPSKSSPLEMKNLLNIFKPFVRRGQDNGK